MFYGTREELLVALKALRRKVCCYSGGEDFCDCKYGFDGTQNRLSEQTGCPELRTAIELLTCMNDNEFNVILGIK